jgi:hypothetical protein
MMNKIELFDPSNIIGLASVIPDSNDSIVKIGALDLNYLEKLIKEIKKRDPCKRGEVRKYTIGYRVNSDRDGVPDNWVGHIILLQKKIDVLEEIKPEDKNIWYAIAPILIEKESGKNE